jgi:hypothetical protein
MFSFILFLSKDIKRHDQGIYRCRVDFRTSQTQSFKYNLTVISEYVLYTQVHEFFFFLFE